MRTVTLVRYLVLNIINGALTIDLSIFPTETIKEQEEYTCSEDDNMSDDPQNGSAAVESAIKVSDIVPKKVPTKSPPVKKTAKISPPGKTAASSKQGSIMNFFKKK